MTYFKLISYELKKLFSFAYIKFILIIVIVLDLAFAYAFFGQTKSGGEYIENVYEMYISDAARFESEYERIMLDWNNPTGDKDGPMSEYSDGYMLDRTLFELVNSFAHTSDDYKSDIDEMISRAEAIKENYSDRTDADASYIVKYQTKLIEKYQYLKENVRIKDEPVYGWNRYFAYGAELILVIIAVLSCAAVIALDDKTTGFVSVRALCLYGRKTTAAAKFSAMVIVCSAISVTVSAVTLFVVSVRYGLSDAGNAIQTVFEDYQLFVGKHEIMHYSPLNKSIGGFVALLFLFKAGVSAFIGMIVMAFASLFNSYISGFIGGAVFTGANYIVSSVESSSLGSWQYMTIFGIYDAKQFWTRYRTVNILGFPVDGIVVCVIIFAVVACVSFAVCIFSAEKATTNNVLLSKNVKLFSKIPAVGSAVKEKISVLYKGSYSLVSHEFYKNRGVLVLLMILIVVRIFISTGYFAFKDTPYNRIYTQYIEQIGGEFTKEKADFIEKEYNEKSAVVALKNKKEADYTDRKITAWEYNDYLKEYNTAQSQLIVLEELRAESARLSHLLEKDGVRGAFVFDKGFKQYEAQGVDWMLILFVCIFCSNSVIIEFKKSSSGGTAFVLERTTPRGRYRLFSTKLLIDAAFAVVAYLMFFGIDMYFLAKNWYLPKRGYLLLSISEYSDISRAMTFGSYFALVFITGIIGVAALAVIIHSVSIILKDAVPVYAACVALTVIPRFLDSVNISFGKYTDITNIIDTDRLFAILYALGVSNATTAFIVIFAVVVFISALIFIISSRSVLGKRRGER